tara:strand:- start:19 stop:846 length:828 start_codon:yes stop_codon:yes gene_type:complete
MKKNLVISFSGGETSAYLCKWLLDNKSNDYNMIFIFANTGDEEEETLNFVNKCSTEWNINIIWVEALVNHKERISSKHKIVNFHTASRNREPFIEVIKKYGIPNQNFLHCNRELKLNPINSYIKSIGWENYETAIGIRIDEIDRVNINRKRFNLIYPLIELKPTTKQEINNWWENQNFRLNLKSYYTNCRTCWKKSDVVLAKIYKENPYYFEFNKQMELIYGKDKYVFFRRGRSTEKLIEDLQKINKLPIDKHKDSNFQTNLFNESCDIYSLCGK